MTEVRISLSDALLACRVGCHRQLYNMARNRQDRFPPNAVGRWDGHIDGAGAEIAVARWMGVEYTGLKTLGQMDVPDVDGFQVRWAKRADGKLAIRSKDKDEDVFILVLGDVYSLRFCLVGWMTAGEARSHGEWYVDVPPPYFAVPQSELHEMSSMEVTP